MVSASPWPYAFNPFGILTSLFIAIKFSTPDIVAIVNQQLPGTEDRSCKYLEEVAGDYMYDAQR